jgi:hypothetical protein
MMHALKIIGYIFGGATLIFVLLIGLSMLLLRGSGDIE